MVRIIIDSFRSFDNERSIRNLTILNLENLSALIFPYQATLDHHSKYNNKNSKLFRKRPYGNPSRRKIVITNVKPVMGASIDLVV